MTLTERIIKMKFNEFRQRLTLQHEGETNLLVRKANYTDGEEYHTDDIIKEGKIVTDLTIGFLKLFDFIDLDIVDGSLTGLAGDGYWLAIAPNGATFMIQDLDNRRNN